MGLPKPVDLSSPDVWYILGAYKGDGYIARRKRKDRKATQFCVVFESTNKSFIEKIQEKSVTICGYTYRIQVNTAHQSYALYISRKKLADWMVQATTISIINELTANKEGAMNFLQGFFNAEGSVTLRNNGKNTYVSFANSNLELLKLAQKLLLEHFGIEAWIHLSEHAGTIHYMNGRQIMLTKDHLKLIISYREGTTRFLTSVLRTNTLNEVVA